MWNSYATGSPSGHADITLMSSVVQIIQTLMRHSLPVGHCFFISSSHPLSFLPFFCFLCLSGFFQFPFEGFLEQCFFSSLFFIYRLVLSFPVSRIAGIIQYLAFSHWLLSPNNMHLQFLHVFSRLASFFLVLNNNPPVRVDHSVSVHHLVRDTLAVFQCCSDAYRCCKHL